MKRSWKVLQKLLWSCLMLYEIIYRSNYVMNDGITGIENCDALLLVGTNPRYEAPVLNARIRKAWVKLLSKHCRTWNGEVCEHFELCFRFLYTDIEIGVIGGDSDLTYDYEHLGSSTKAIDDVLAGKSAFAKVSRLDWILDPTRIIRDPSFFKHCKKYYANNGIFEKRWSLGWFR